jgi:hypothetical protein
VRTHAPDPLIASSCSARSSAVGAALRRRCTPRTPTATRTIPTTGRTATPPEGYWQQDVHYLHEGAAGRQHRRHRHREAGSLTYWNNSPDTLREVFFHLYQNAYVPARTGDGRRTRRTTGGVARGHTDLLVATRGSDRLRTELDNTVLRAGSRTAGTRGAHHLRASASPPIGTDDISGA